MATLAIVGYLSFFALAFVGRALLQLARTGSTGVKGIRPGAGPLEAGAGVLLVVAIAASGTAPWLAHYAVLEPLGALDTTAAHATGIALFLLGLTATLGAQLAMGADWRVGIDAAEPTGLVTGGPFELVRNPIYSGMLIAFTGLVLMTPSLLALVGLAGIWLAIEAQVRSVEEPHLMRTHREAFAAYAARTGRFLPGVGRLRAKRALPPPAPH